MMLFPPNCFLFQGGRSGTSSDRTGTRAGIPRPGIHAWYGERSTATPTRPEETEELPQLGPQTSRQG